jgi:hypothetical protein
MVRYESLNYTDGAYYLLKIESVFFKPLQEDSFFVEPWDNHELRKSATFRSSSKSKGGGLEIVFDTDDQEVTRLLSGSQEVYLYGAYNYVAVCQMRAKCSVDRDGTRFCLTVLDYAYSVYERG